MNLSTVKWVLWDKTQSKELLGLFIWVCMALCTIVAHNIAQNRPDSFPPYPPDNHYRSDDVYLREGGGAFFHHYMLYFHCQMDCHASTGEHNIIASRNSLIKFLRVGRCSGSSGPQRRCRRTNQPTGAHIHGRWARFVLLMCWHDDTWNMSTARHGNSQTTSVYYNYFQFSFNRPTLPQLLQAALDLLNENICGWQE